MELTINFIRESFRKYNEKYFQGNLVEPTFEIINTKTILGRFKVERLSYSKKLYTIEISRYYLRNAKQYDNTIIHEMIHQHIEQNGIKDNSSHGRYFKHFASIINKDGWNICAYNSMENIEIDTKNKKEYNVFVAKNQEGKYFLFVSAKSSVCVFKKFLDSLKREYKYFVSHDSLKYDELPACRRRLLGRYITKDEYDKINE